MTLTIKFSEMTAGGDLPNNSSTPGLLGGANVLFNNPWTFLAAGPTANRPPPSSAINYRLRLNTDTQTYEYYDAFVSMWVELSGSGTGTINPGITNDLAFYPANGTTLSPIAAAASSVLVTSAGSVPSLSTTLPSGLSIPGATITSSTAALTAGSVVAAPVAGSDLVNKTYADGLYTASVHSIIGTTDQVIASSPTGDVQLSLPQSIGTGNSPTFSALTLSSTNVHGVLLGEAAGAIVSVVPSATSGVPLISQGSSADPTYGTAVVAGGGTGNTTFTAYSVICAGTTATGAFQNVSGLGTLGYVLTSNGAGALPTWQAVSASGAIETITADDAGTVTPNAGAVIISGGSTGLTTSGTSHTLTFTGTLNETHGGTNQSTYTLGDTLYSSAANTLSKLAGNITTAKQYLSQTGTGAVSAAPAWATISGSDITGAALTKTDDTNVTLTLGGTPTTALLRAASLTLGWTGQLAVGRGGTGVSSVTVSPTATAFAGWDANKNLSANSFIEGFRTTATAGATTTLVVGDAEIQEFTGTLTQTVVLPVTSTLVAGQSYTIINNSTGVVTVQSSGANTIQAMAANTTLIVTCVLNSGTTAASWNGSYIADAGGGVSAGTANQLAYYQVTGNIVSGLTSANSSVLVTSAGGVPSLSTTLPSGIAATNMTLTTPAIGTPSSGVATNLTATGGLRSRQIFTTGTSATYTKPANVTSILVEVWGGGGAGGGAAGGATGRTCGGGGGAGGYANLFIAAASGTYTYSVGAAGSLGTAGNHPGGNGGTTSFGASLQATGGTGGGGGANVPSTGGAASGASGVSGVGTNGDINASGNPGSIGNTMIVSGVFAVTLIAQGGSAIYGAAGYAATGSNAAGFGAGGGGGSTITAADAQGLVGGSGLIIVWEYS